METTVPTEHREKSQVCSVDAKSTNAHDVRVAADGAVFFSVADKASLHKTSVVVDAAGMHMTSDLYGGHTIYVDVPASELYLCESRDRHRPFFPDMYALERFAKKHMNEQVVMHVTGKQVSLSCKNDTEDATDTIHDKTAIEPLQQSSNTSLKICASDVHECANFISKLSKTIEFLPESGCLTMVGSDMITAVCTWISVRGTDSATLDTRTVIDILEDAGDSEIAISWGPESAVTFEYGNVVRRLMPNTPDDADDFMPQLSDSCKSIMTDVKGLIQTIAMGAKLNDEMRITFDDLGLHYRTIDGCRTCIIEGTIPKRLFTEYRLRDSSPSIELNPQETLDRLKVFDEGAVKILINKNGTVLARNSYQIIALPWTVVESPAYVPDVNASYGGNIMLNASDALKSLAFVSKNEWGLSSTTRLSIDGGLHIESTDHGEKLAVTIGDSKGKSTGGVFDTYHLNYVLELATGYVTFGLSDGGPLMMECNGNTIWLASVPE